MSYLKLAPSNLFHCNFLRRNKNAQIWDQKCLIWMFLGWNSKTILSHWKSAPLNLSNCQISWNNETHKFGPKNALFGYFWPKMSYLGTFRQLGWNFWKKYCHIWNQHPQICLIAKIFEKMKMPKFGTSNALFRYF